MKEISYKHRPTEVKAFQMDQKSYDYILAHYTDKLERWERFPKFIQEALLLREGTSGSIYRPFNVDLQLYYKTLFLATILEPYKIHPMDFIVEKRNHLSCVSSEVFNMLYEAVE